MAGFCVSGFDGIEPVTNGIDQASSGCVQILSSVVLG